jgi:hypothetical protein
MTAFGRVRPLLSRLLLSLAIVTCVLGLSDAATASSAPPAAYAASASTTDTGHAAHQHAGVASSAPVQAAPAPADGHAGHGEGAGVHAVGCMVAVGVAAIAFLLALGFFQMSGGAESTKRLRARVRAGRHPRPPNLTTLCVQRV